MNSTVSRTFVERMEMEDSYVLELICGHNVEGVACYHVVLLPANKVDELRRNLGIKAVELAEYGEVLSSGEGHEPPPGLIDELRAKITKK